MKKIICRCKKLFFIIVLTFLAGTFSIGLSYAVYKKGVEVNISTTTGQIMISADLDNPNTYVSKEGNTYFYLTLRNYNDENILTDVKYSCDVKINNNNSSDGYFKYKYETYLKNIDGSELTDEQISELDFTPDEGVDDDEENNKNILRRNFVFTNKFKDSKKIMIEVIAYDSNNSKVHIKQNIDFKINVRCVQKIL